MEELQVVNELIENATKLTKTVRKLKQLGFGNEEINDMVDHFVVQQIKQFMEE